MHKSQSLLNEVKYSNQGKLLILQLRGVSVAIPFK